MLLCELSCGDRVEIARLVRRQRLKSVSKGWRTGISAGSEDTVFSILISHPLRKGLILRVQNTTMVAKVANQYRILPHASLIFSGTFSFLGHVRQAPERRSAVVIPERGPQPLTRLTFSGHPKPTIAPGAPLFRAQWWAVAMNPSGVRSGAKMPDPLWVESAALIPPPARLPSHSDFEAGCRPFDCPAPKVRPIPARGNAPGPQIFPKSGGLKARPKPTRACLKINGSIGPLALRPDLPVNPGPLAQAGISSGLWPFSFSSQECFPYQEQGSVGRRWREMPPTCEASSAH